MRAWSRWYIKSEATMLICGILPFELQSHRLTDFYRPQFLHLKRYIVEARYWFSIKVESNIILASGMRLKLDWGRWWSFTFPKVKGIFWVVLLRGVENSTTSTRTGSDDASGDTCIISSSRFCLRRGFAIELSENKGVVAEAASLSFSSRLPWDASRSFSNGSLGGDQDREHQRCGSLD
jgi:hypothetical protein